MNVVGSDFRQFAILGSGRVALHMSHYLNLLGLPFITWRRDLGAAALLSLPERASHILISVSDSALDEVAAPLRGRPDITLVHFSGALNIPGVFSAHPLMTFGTQLQTLDWYRAIPFVIEPDAELSRLLPGLPNAAVRLPRECKALYHALCALAGNSTQHLWSAIGEEFERIGLPRQLLAPYLHQVVENSVGRAGAANNLTGPVARGDWAVVRGNLRALAGRADLLEAYQSFLRQARTRSINVPGDLI